MNDKIYYVVSIVSMRRNF